MRNVQRSSLQVTLRKQDSIFLCVQRLIQLDLTGIRASCIINPTGITVVSERDDSLVRINDASPYLTTGVFAASSDYTGQFDKGLVP